nr:condensation domain-containing protein [Methylobacterium tarhaniae]
MAVTAYVRSRPSKEQTDLLIAEMLRRPEDVFNLVEAVQIVGQVSMEHLKAALAALVERHRMLRTSFHYDGRTWYRQTCAVVDLSIEHRDLTVAGGEVLAQDITAAAIAFGRQPFDLAAAPLIRFLILKAAEERHILVLAVHHLVADGWSLSVLLREFQLLYAGAKDDLAPIETEDPDACEEASDDGTEDVVKGLPEAAPEQSDLPLDWARNGTPFTPRSVCRRLDRDEWNMVAESARRSSVTRNTVLIGALARILRRWTGQSRIIINMPVANRSGRRTRNAVGLFTRMTSVRLGTDETPSGVEDLAYDTADELVTVQAAVKRAVRAARLQPSRSASSPQQHHPGHHISFNYIPWDAGDMPMAGAHVSRQPIPNIFSKADIAFYVRKDDCGGAEIEIVYDEALFERLTIEQIVKKYYNELTESSVINYASCNIDRNIQGANHELDDEGVIERLAAHALIQGAQLRSPSERLPFPIAKSMRLRTGSPVRSSKRAFAGAGRSRRSACATTPYHWFSWASGRRERSRCCSMAGTPVPTYPA